MIVAENLVSTSVIAPAFLFTAPGNFIVYDLATGLIHKQILGMLTYNSFDMLTENYLAILPPISADGMQTSKVDLDTLTIVPKTPIPYNIGGLAIANSSSVLSVEDLPDGTIYEYEVIEDNLLEFTFDTPGPFVIELTNPLYSPTTIEIDVLEP